MLGVRRRAQQIVLLLVVLLVYLALGTRYAFDTPPWQAPDEPAHYNYIAQIVDDGHLPVLEDGDYPYERLEALKASGFPDDGDIDGIAYEDYQPPAYYLLAAAPVALSGPELLDRLAAARVLGVFLGAITVTLAWAVARRAVPDDAFLAVAAASFVAFLPMHLAMNATANNDPLAYVLGGALLYAALSRAARRLSARRYALVGGVLFAGALLTKVSIYPTAVLLVAGEMAAAWATAGIGPGSIGARMWARSAARGLLVCAIGAALAAPWFVRTANLYGWSDPLGIGRHNRLAVAQPHTAAWIADNGLAAWLTRFVTFTHKSFWGVFGWMGVFLDARIYWTLAAVVVLVAIGFAFFVAQNLRDCRQRRARCVGLALPALAVSMSVFVYLAYNVTYLQHQGRYLFTALIPLAIFFHLGLRQLVRTVGRRLVPTRLLRPLEIIAMTCIALSMTALAILSLTRYIVPGLS